VIRAESPDRSRHSWAPDTVIRHNGSRPRHDTCRLTFRKYDWLRRLGRSGGFGYPTPLRGTPAAKRPG
jgi:hypothetical protein